MNDLDKNLSTESAQQTKRLTSRARQSSYAFTDALRRAASVLREDLLSTGLDAVDDPLFAAASLVAKHQQISLKPINRSAHADTDEYLAAICGAAQIALRKVTLERDWFHKDKRASLGIYPKWGGQSGRWLCCRGLLPVTRC